MLGWVEMGASSAGFLRVNFCHASLAALARRLNSERSVSAFCVFVDMWTSGANGSAGARGPGWMQLPTIARVVRGVRALANLWSAFQKVKGRRACNCCRCATSAGRWHSSAMDLSGALRQFRKFRQAGVLGLEWPQLAAAPLPLVGLACSGRLITRYQLALSIANEVGPAHLP